jgi:hypothetical protein
MFVVVIVVVRMFVIMIVRVLVVMVVMLVVWSGTAAGCAHDGLLALISRISALTKIFYA